MARYRRRKRKRRGYVRPSRARPKQGWSLRELAALSGTSTRNIRAYLERELVPRAPFHASATRYDRRQLLWLLAIRRLRESERLPLARIRARLEVLPPTELEALATEGLTAGALASALGITAPDREAAPSRADASPSPTEAWRRPLPRWTRVELALGLELHVRDDASPETLELARRMQALRNEDSQGSRSGDSAAGSIFAASKKSEDARVDL
ncbi:MAG TPA: MerR family transcriptional regulator [Polyangiaceae bacterium]|nr:MerR family transcriptional regulator [Polyangiaceae bacterium]